jgi:cytoskeletal protein CcmA (bactofilin family)
MREFHGKIEGPFSIEEDLTLHGMITAGATVQSGVVLHLHGTITGDLTVERGGQAIIHGTVNGTVFNNGGDVSILGTVDDVADLSTESRTLIDSGALIRKRQQ